MARDAAGVYTRVSNSFSSPTTGNIISPTDAETFFDDVETALNSLPIVDSAGLRAALSDETGTGVAVFATSPTLTTPNISGNAALTNNTNGVANFTVSNNNSTPLGAAAAIFTATNGTNSIVFGQRGTNQAVYGILTANRSYIYGATDFAMVSDGGNIVFGSKSGALESGRFSAGGGFSVGTTTDAGAGAALVNASIKSQGATGGIGYATGAGGTVTQATSKATGVTLNTVCGAITMNNAALAAATIVSFVLTDSAIAATDVLVLNHISGGTVGSYTLNARAAAGSATIDVRNNTAGSLGEAIVIQFAVVKGVNA